MINKICLAQDQAFTDIGYQPVEEGRIQRFHSFACKDIGIDCTFETQGATDQELMRGFIDHAESALQMQVLPADIIFKLQKAIKK